MAYSAHPPSRSQAKHARPHRRPCAHVPWWQVSVRQADAELQAALARQADESERTASAALRAADERECRRLREKDEEAARARREADARVASVEAELERTSSRLEVAAAAVASAEERAHASAARLEQMHAEKGALSRDASAMRAEALSARERSEVMQKLLAQRTEYMRKLQLAATKREEQLTAHYTEKQREATEAIDAELRQQKESDGGTLADPEPLSRPNPEPDDYLRP